MGTCIFLAIIIFVSYYLGITNSIQDIYNNITYDYENNYNCIKKVINFEEFNYV